MTLTIDQRTRAFTDAITFSAFVASSVNFTDELRGNFAATRLSELDHQLLAEILVAVGGPLDVLAIVEDWCPDVAANLPIIARIAEDSDALRLHVLTRDAEHRDIADAYPYEGRSHIPTYVFFDAAEHPDGQRAELGVIVERPAPVRVLDVRFLDLFFTEHPELDRATFPAGLTDPLRAELTARSVQLRHEHRDLERSSLIEAIRAIVTARHAATARS